MFNKIDENGDEAVSVLECAKMLETLADEKGLKKDEIMKKVNFFFETADFNNDGEITMMEFFIRLPELEKLLANEE